MTDTSKIHANMNDFKSYNETYAEYFGTNAPVRTTIAVDRLPHPLILMEMSLDPGATAYKPLQSFFSRKTL